MILIKFIAQNSELSRRNSERAIKYGEVTVNGKVIYDPSFEINENDNIFLGKKKILKRDKIYIILNKPYGFVTTKSDPSNRPVVMSLIPANLRKILDPIGRLDFNTSGALILTNDGDLNYKLSHPKFSVKKIYSVFTSRNLDEELVENLKKGVRLEDGFVKPDKIIWRNNSPKRLTIELHSGKYRVIRRMFEIFKIYVKKLHRLSFANISLNLLKPGEFRYLTEDEIEYLVKLKNK